MRRQNDGGLAQPDWEHLEALFDPGEDRSVQPLSTSALAFVLLRSRDHFAKPFLCVTDGPRTQDQLFHDLLTLDGGSEERLAFYPGWETLPDEDSGPHPDIVGDRLAVLHTLAQPAAPKITVTTVQAIMQKTISLDRLRQDTLRLSVGDGTGPEKLTESLGALGYGFQVQISEKGETAVRGCILDVWPLSEPWPLRLDFFGDDLESIRAFDPNTQCSIEMRQEATISPAAEWAAEGAGQLDADLFDALHRETCVVWLDPQVLALHAQVFEETVEELSLGALALTYERARIRAEACSTFGSLCIGATPDSGKDFAALGIRAIEGVPAVPGLAESPDPLERERIRFLSDLDGKRARGTRVSFYFNTEGTRDRFSGFVAAHVPGLHQHADRNLGQLSEGFEVPDAGRIVVSESDVYGTRKAVRGRYDLHASRKGPSRLASLHVLDWTDLRPGEFVVHIEHGIGKYLGLQEIETHGSTQEVLSVEYAEKARLYIPVGQTHLLSRYVGTGAKPPGLHRLGGRRWKNEKRAAQLAVRDLAAMMMETQAMRDTRAGFAFAPDDDWQREFEASFPFQETPDQHQAIQDVKADMERLRPTDRLVCGDVGYGKTEIAMRAAFKAVMSGKQVGMLVPTTVLAQQHYDTFRARMKAFPVTIEMLSRFQTRSRLTEIIRQLRAGAVDIVIGTHRLLQRDVEFQDLGLLIIDEEQRFGVEQKEYFKQVRQLVDVLTLSATPIPRTLYLSLLGAKDMSTIQTPPQERLPIETFISPYSEDVIRHAILRELNREGQVYFLHNRVLSIRRVEDRLKQLVPEARIAVGHGQMKEGELAAVMRAFYEGTIDVLLCTTIIESGVDIPNVNTIVIDRADRFGLAELYQLRGRVGRYKHQAYAYLLLPPSGSMISAARRRISALQRYGSLGAGFKLALKDLEIRGTGNLLGAEQSGHIGAIGFELYCQFLTRTVARLQGEEVPPLVETELKLDFLNFSTAAAEGDDGAVLPLSYIEDEDLRVHAYRKISTTGTESAIDSLFTEFTDRFGPVPSAVNRLLKMCRIRILASSKDITLVETRGDRVMMTRDNDYVKDGSRFPRLSAPDADTRLNQLIAIVRNTT
jgi:transcription-repair coupling factor (superfamily II helicase)